MSQYELAFRMQVSVPEVMDIAREPKQVIEAYGAQPGASSLANNILLARRLVEKGVRFVQLFDWGWDFHGTNPGEDIRDGLTNKCKTMDRAIASLIKDLRQRGLLDETLVVIGGEFGRTPFREGRTAGSKLLGRDHYPDCYTMLLAGAGVKRGFSYRRDRRLGLLDHQEQSPRQRPASHDPASIGFQPRETDLSLPGPRLPPHRRGGARGERYLGLTLCGQNTPLSTKAFGDGSLNVSCWRMVKKLGRCVNNAQERA